MGSALRFGLARLVDYAGLFPPAALALPDVVERYGRYAASGERWMLGRLIVRLADLDPLERILEARRGAEAPWRISVLLAADTPLADLAGRLGAFDRAHHARGIAIGSVELAPASIDDLARLPALPPSVERYVELPMGPAAAGWLDAIARAGCLAKIRTGGLTEDRFPSAADVAGFLRATVAHRVAFKATAGLHHPLRNRYRLTYEPESPSGRMHGFVNLVLAASLALRDPGVADDTLASLLEESDPRAFAFTPDTVRWNGRELSAAHIADARRRAVRSVGSCSFEEPVADLRDLGWLDPEDSAR